MPLYNPYSKFDQGMEDAYTGKEPSQRNREYMEGYNLSIQLERDEENKLREKQQEQEYLTHSQAGER